MTNEDMFRAFFKALKRYERACRDNGMAEHARAYAIMQGPVHDVLKEAAGNPEPTPEAMWRKFWRELDRPAPIKTQPRRMILPDLISRELWAEAFTWDFGY